MSTNLAAEALAAVTGIWPEGPPSMADLLAAEGMQDRWATRIKKLLAGKQQPLKWSAPPADLHRRCTMPVHQADIAAWLEAMGDAEVGIAYAHTITEARDYLASLFPTIDLPGILPEVAPAGQDEIAEVWSVARVLDSPDALLDDAAAWAVTPSQVTAWRAIYPELSAALNTQLTWELGERVAAGKPISWQVESVIRVLRGVDPEAPIVVAPPEEQPAQPPAKRVDFAATRTPSEAASLP